VGFPRLFGLGGKRSVAPADCSVMCNVLRERNHGITAFFVDVDDVDGNEDDDRTSSRALAVNMALTGAADVKVSGWKGTAAVGGVPAFAADAVTLGLTSPSMCASSLYTVCTSTGCGDGIGDVGTYPW
jgi:hypothetical protein